MCHARPGAHRQGRREALARVCIRGGLTPQQLSVLKTRRPSEATTESEIHDIDKESEGGSSVTEGGSKFVKRERHQHFEDSVLPDGDELTLSYLKANPGFILRVIFEKRSELCLRALKKITYKGINQTDCRGCTALHLAAEKDLDQVCSELLNRSIFKGPNALDCYNWNALHRGARYGSYNACKALLGHPRFTVMDQACESGWTALHLASMHGHSTICFLLVSDHRFTEQSAQDEWGRTALHCAAEHGHPEACQALLTHGFTAKEIALKNKWGHTAEETATDEGTAKIIKYAHTSTSQEEKAERRDNRVMGSIMRSKIKRDARPDGGDSNRTVPKVGRVTFTADDESMSGTPRSSV